MKELVRTIKPSILFIHNRYLHKGGEDSVVQNEMEVLKKNGYPVHYLEFSNDRLQKKSWRLAVMPFQLFFNVAAFFKVYFFVRKQSIQIVHVHNFYYTASPSVFWGAKAAGAHTIMTLHNYRLFCLNGIFFRNESPCFVCHTEKEFGQGIHAKCFKSSKPFSAALAWSTLFHRKVGTWTKKVDRFIAINPSMPGFLKDVGIPGNAIFTKPNFLAVSGASRYCNYASRNDYYLYVGRLSVEKGVKQLVETFSRLKKKLVIIGEGELAGFVQQHVSEYIRYEGPQPKEILFHHYTQCLAFVFPSLWLEGMPMTLIEAQSTGAIPIAAATITTNQIITHQEDGFLYHTDSDRDLDKVINIFEALPLDEKNRISANAYQHFLSHYSETQHNKAIETIYHF